MGVDHLLKGQILYVRMTEKSDYKPRVIQQITYPTDCKISWNRIEERCLLVICSAYDEHNLGGWYHLNLCDYHKWVQDSPYEYRKDLISGEMKPIYKTATQRRNAPYDFHF